MGSFTTGLCTQKNLVMNNLTLLGITFEKGDGESLKNKLLCLPC